MKKLFVIASNIVVAASVAILSGCNPASPSANSGSSAEIEKLKMQLAEAQARPTKESAVQIIQALGALDPQPSKTRIRTVRQIIQRLEELSACGKDAVRPVLGALQTGKDIDYTFDDPHANISMWNWHPGQPVFSGLVLPPSLRLALVDVLKNIGGQEVEGALLLTMNSTTSAVELAYISQVLEEIAPGQYSALADIAAKKLLANPAAIKTGGPLDSNPQGSLYGVLSAHGDTSLTTNALAGLMKQGQLDFEAARYLVNTMKQQAIPELQKIYSTASPQDQNRIANLAFNYVGANASADQIFKDWLLNNGVDDSKQSITARPRATMIGLLGNAAGDKSVIQNRIDLLTSLESQVAEPGLKVAMDKSIQAMHAKLGN